MNLKDRMILEDYRKNKQDFVEMGDIVNNKLHEIVEKCNVKAFAIEHRVKKEKSLIGKLHRSEGYYNQFSDLMDILGARIICSFSDEVDILGKEIEKEFVIDKINSSDKRALIKADSFGYLSLHYICSLKESDEYDSRLCKWRFEIQIRTALQHVWSDIEHDMGYKSEFGVPRGVVRGFSRVAGLLEIADDEFVRIRDIMKNYTENIRQRIVNNTADDIIIDSISLAEYMKRNLKMQEFLHELASFSDAQIDEISPENYIEQLEWFHITTIGQLQNLLKTYKQSALDMAKNALTNSDLDIISSNAALLYLCRAKLVHEYSKEQALQFLMINSKDEKRAQRLVNYIYRYKDKI